MNSSNTSDALAPESQLRQLYEQAPLPYQSLDNEGRLLSVNRAWEEALGYPREEVLGRHIGAFHAPGQEDHLRQKFADFLSRDFLTGVEMEYRCKDGTHKLMSVSGRIARDHHGRFLRTHCILNDITMSRRIEKALHESEEKYRLAMEATQDGLWDWDVTTGGVDYSPGWSHILGEEDAENIYLTWETRIHPEDKPRILNTLRSHLAGETASWQEEHRLRNAQGAWIWVLGRGRVVKRDQHGNPLRMVGTMTDINARKLAEVALRGSEKRLRSLINATTEDVVVLLDTKLRIALVNERAAHVFGKTVDQMKGLSLGELMPPAIAKNRQAHAEKVINSRQSVRFEDHRANRWYDNNMCPVLDDDGNTQAVAIFARDITERKRTEQALAQTKEAAELANTSKTRFLAAASHDLRQPLQAISSHADLLAACNTNAALAKPITQLADAALAMHELLESLLDVSKLDSGMVRPNISALSISSLLSQLQDQYEPMAVKKGLVLTVMPSTAVVRSDPALLRVILQNLISNAIKYTPEGAVVIECRHSGDQLTIEVSDSGIGIPEEEHEMIFEEFYQLGNPARDRNLGSGMGLAIAKRIADLLNHPLYTHSVVGRGTRFAIQAPLADEAREQTHAAHSATAKDHYGTTGGSILLIEDNEIVLDANNGLLTALGYNVIACPDAETAIQSLESGSPPPDIIISDHRLPGDWAGTELVQRLRSKAGRLIPAIILTGDITVPDDNSSLPHKSLLMRKPARVDELVQAINQLLGNQVRSAG